MIVAAAKSSEASSGRLVIQHVKTVRAWRQKYWHFLPAVSLSEHGHLHSVDCPMMSPGQDDTPSAATKGPAKAYWTALWESRTYKNDASVARDLLANERTFLAWLRTGLNAAALGIVLAKFAVSFAPVHIAFAQVLGCCLVILSIIFVFIGLWRQVSVRIALENGTFPSPGWTFTLTSMLVVAVLIAAFVFIVMTEHVKQ